MAQPAADLQPLLGAARVQPEQPPLARVGRQHGFTPFDLVAYVAVHQEHTDRDWRRNETRRVLESVGLADVMHKKIRSLSGGVRQRVALAAALLGSPDLPVLDEPAAGLYPEQRLQRRSLLSGAGTVVMATHDVSEVAALCQVVHVLFAGRIRFTGTPAWTASPRVTSATSPGTASSPTCEAATSVNRCRPAALRPRPMSPPSRHVAVPI